MLSRLLRKFSGGGSTAPTLLHLTHAKAGSTWITVILHELFKQSVTPRGTRVAGASGGDLSQHVFEAGMVYPSMFMTREEVLAHAELNGCKRFIVIRDLRDTLAALYFSVKLSASTGDAPFEVWENENEETGLLEMLDSRITRIAAIQASWLNQGEIVLRYEDLMENDFDLLRDAFIHRLALPVSESALHRAIRAAPAERGRRTGAVDWRKHFTPKISARFAERFGRLLIDTGYEKDLAWASSTLPQAGV
ncbi:MAG: hypothetical protein ABIZ56_06330 [Chthoniobacteraceae bacterium]